MTDYDKRMTVISEDELAALEACASALRKATTRIIDYEARPDVDMGIELWAGTEGYDWLREADDALRNLDELR